MSRGLSGKRLVNLPNKRSFPTTYSLETTRISVQYPSDYLTLSKTHASRGQTVDKGGEEAMWKRGKEIGGLRKTRSHAKPYEPWQ